MILDWMGKEEKEETDRRHVDGLSSRNIGETMREMHCPMMSYWAKRGGETSFIGSMPEYFS